MISVERYFAPSAAVGTPTRDSGAARLHSNPLIVVFIESQTGHPLETAPKMSTLKHTAGLSHRQDRRWLGLSLFVLNILLMTVVGAFVKELSDRYPVFQMLLARFGPSALAFFLLSLKAGAPLPHHTKRPFMHLIRSATGVTSIGCMFYAFSAIPFAEATVLVYASPLFVTVLAIPFLGESVGARRWTAVLAGFAGVLVIVWPSLDLARGEIGIGTLAAATSALFAGMVSIYLRKLGDTEPTAHIAFVYNFFGSILFLGGCLWVGFVLPTGWDIAMFAVIAILGVGQQFMFTACYRYAEASLLAPFEYIALPLAAIVGFLYWDEVPAATTWIGAAIIVASGLFVLHRERKRGPGSEKPATLHPARNAHRR